MNVQMRVIGLDESIERINDEINRIEKLSMAGLWEAGLKVLRAAQKRLKPSVITGNLRASGYVRSNANTDRPDPANLISSKNEPIPGNRLPEIGLEVGFTANYALYAHENMEGRAPKFLESVIVENEREIIRIIAVRSGADSW